MGRTSVKVLVYKAKTFRIQKNGILRFSSPRAGEQEKSGWPAATRRYAARHKRAQALSWSVAAVAAAARCSLLRCVALRCERVWAKKAWLAACRPGVEASMEPGRRSSQAHPSKTPALVRFASAAARTSAPRSDWIMRWNRDKTLVLLYHHASNHPTINLPSIPSKRIFLGVACCVAGLRGSVRVWVLVSFFVGF